MREHRGTLLSEILPPDERVIEAVVARYQRVAPAITRFARTLSGDDGLQVRLGSQAASAEGEIVIDPGVFQAAYARQAPVTPTEVALATALHEAIHLVATDLDERRPIPPRWHELGAYLLPDDDDVADHDRGAGVSPSSPPEAVSPLMFLDAPADTEPPPPEVAAAAEAADDAGPEPAATTVLDALAELAGPAAETLFLSVEDARQELRYFAEYQGARAVLTDLYLAAVPEALAEARPLAQYGLGCFLLVGGYLPRADLQRKVAGHVAAALDEAADTLARIRATEDPWDVGEAVLELLVIARRHGLVSTASASQKPNERQEQMEAEAEAISDGVDAVRIVTPPLRDVEAYEQTRHAGQSVAAEHGAKGAVDEAGDPGTDQLVRVSEAPTVYLPTGQGGKLVVAGFPDRFRHFGAKGRDLLAEAAVRWEVMQRRVSGELYPLFLANQRRGLRSGFDAGDLSPYAALLLGAGLYERMFERRDLPTRRSYGVSLLVDGSASMLQPRAVAGGRHSPWALAAATLGAWTLAQLCDELQIDFEVALFNRSFAAAADDTEQSFSDRRRRATGALRRSHGGAAERLTRTVNHYLVKGFDSGWRSAEDLLAGLFFMAARPQDAARDARQQPELAPPVSMFDKAANVDEFNVSYAAQRLSSRRASTRILVVLADGMTRGSVQALADSVASAEASGSVVLGIGIGDDTVQAAYDRNQVVERPDELASAMVDGVRSTLFRTLASVGGETWWAQSSERALRALPIRRSINA